MTTRGLIASTLFAVGILHEALCQSSDSTYVLTVKDDILGIESRSEEESKETMYILSKDYQETSKAAISHTLITQDQILRSGATNLPEILRLSPDFVVRQSTHGNYKVHLRGSTPTGENLIERNTVLLMINEVPYYNFMEQDTWWETIPVSLHDIEQIEIVRFPHGAWYGPEAAEGIINIVTKSDNGIGLKTQANARVGLNNNYAYQGSISFFQGGNFRAKASAFYNEFSRFQNATYVFSQSRYVNSDSLLFYQINARNTNPNPTSALQNSGIHFNADYQWSKDAQVRIGAGTQNSDAQGVFRKIEEIALSNRLANTNWLSLRGHWKPLRFYASYQHGSTAYNGYDHLQWDNNTQWLGRVEYARKWKKYQLGLGTEVFNFKYSDSLTNSSGVEATDYSSSWSSLQRYSTNFSQQLLLSKDRVIFTLANRLDYYSNIEALLMNHQFSSLVTLFPSHKISASISFNERLPRQLDNENIISNDLIENNGTITRSGNFTPTLQKMLAYEVKYRSQISKNIQADITYFHYQPQDEIDNVLSFERSGFAANIDWQINRLLLSGNITHIQFHEVSNELSANPLPEITSSVTGRYSAFFDKLQAFIGLNYYSHYTYQTQTESLQLPSRINLSTKLSYQIWEEHSIFISGQNILNSRNLEYPFGDVSQSMYWLGMNLRF